jgi:putative membrane protein
MGFMMFFMIFFWLLLLAPIVLLIVYWIRPHEGPHPMQGGPREDPIEILRMRYARGEINNEQFEQMRKDLQD